MQEAKTSKAQLATLDRLHLIKDETLRSSWVSARSQWSDDRWELDYDLPGAARYQSTINWKIPFEDGSFLTDDEYYDVLDWLRRWLWSLLSDPRENAAPISPGTVPVLSAGIRTFVPWMVSREYRRPRELTNAALEMYLEDLPELIAEVSDRDDEGEITYSQAWNRVRIPRLIWQQRTALEEVGIEPMPEEPYDGLSTKEVCGDIVNKAQGWIQPLPDEVAVPLLNKAAWYLGTPASDVTQLQIACWDAYHRAPRPSPTGGGTSGPARATRQRKAAEKFKFSKVDGRQWHPNLTPGLDVAGKHISVTQRARQLVLTVRTAACIVIQATTGMRTSELCGLKSGIDPTTGLPSGIRVVESASGLNDVFLLRTKLSKTESTPRDVDWLIGMRPKGSNQEPIAVRAIRILGDLLEPYRNLFDGDDLIFAFRNNVGFPKTKEGVCHITGDNLARALKDFMEREIDLSELPSTSRRPHSSNDLEEWKASRGRIIRPHQFRKTYAHFVIQTDSRLMPALQMQFHHISQGMTEAGYIGASSIQLDDLRSVSRQETAYLLYEMATGKSLATGRQAKAIHPNLGEIQKLIEGESFSTGWRSVMRFVDEKGLRMFFAPHGICMPLDPGEMRCHQAAGTRSWLNRAPNYSTREAAICAGCRQFLYDARHTDFWKKRFVANTLAAQRCEEIKTGSGAVFASRATQARAFLKNLGVSDEELDERIGVGNEERNRD